MSDKLEDKAVEILDKADVAISTFADKLGELAKQYGPEVADAAFALARIDAISTLLTPFLCLVLCSAALRWAWKPAWEWSDKDKYGDREFAVFMGLCVLGVGVLTSFFMLADVWAWVGIFEPKLWLAKRVLGL